MIQEQFECENECFNNLWCGQRIGSHCTI